MTKIVKLKDVTDYRKHTIQTTKLITTFQESLYAQIMNYAALDKWKDWSDSKEIGSVVPMDEPLLRSIDDKNIAILFELIDKCNESKERIAKEMQ